MFVWLFKERVVNLFLDVFWGEISNTFLLGEWIDNDINVFCLQKMRFETQMKTGLDVSKEIKQTPVPPQELSMYSLLKTGEVT